MKNLFFIIVTLAIFTTSCAKAPQKDQNLSVDNIDKTFQKHINSEMGYCDVSQYYLENYFSKMPIPSAYKIFTSNDSTNFDEYGIFEFKTVKQAKQSASKIKDYLIQSKKEFQSGIVYNVEEYPKFENSTLKNYGRYIVYAILSPEKTCGILNDIDKMKKGLTSPYFVTGTQTFAIEPFLINSLQTALA